MDTAPVLCCVLPCPECGLREWADSGQSAISTYTPGQTTVRSHSSQSTTHTEPIRDINSTAIKANFRTSPALKSQKKSQVKKTDVLCQDEKKKKVSTQQAKNLSSVQQRGLASWVHRCLGHTQIMRTACSFPPYRHHFIQTLAPHPSSEMEQRDACIRVTVNSQRAHGDRTMTGTVGFCFNSDRHTCATQHISLQAWESP